MKLVFKLLKIVGLLVGVLVVALGVLLFVTFSGGMPVLLMSRPSPAPIRAC